MFEDEPGDEGLIHNRSFTVGKSRYRFFVNRSYEVGFELVYGGAFQGGVFPVFNEWCDRVSGTQTTGSAGYRAVEVFRGALKLLSEYVWEAQPPFFYFVAMEANRHSLYRRLVPRIEEMTRYKYTGENRGESCEQFTFYRVARQRTNATRED